VQDISNGVRGGHDKLQEAQERGGVVLPQTSPKGQELIKEELKMLVDDYEGFESDLAGLTNTLSESCH
jgi:hypothetical protein